MQVFEIVIALLLGGAGLAALARRIGSPYPALVALAGAALALVPGTPELVLDPELALALFVAPKLGGCPNWVGASRSAEQHVCGLFAVCARTIPRVVAQVVA